MPADAGPAAAGTAAADGQASRNPGDVGDGGAPAEYPGPGSAGDPVEADAEDNGVIAGERAHLARSRELLRLMRENVLTLAQNPMAGDRVSLEYLKADLYRRAEALKDLPDTPLFFGRLDYAERPLGDDDPAGSSPPGAPGGGPPGTARGVPGGGPPGTALYIGRRHVHDGEGTPVVLDWRAPVSRPFYRASQTDPMGLTLRRRFGFAGGALTAYEDERFGLSGETANRSGEAGARSASGLLIAEIERPRSGPMRDIVATIQPEQDDIVRAGAATTVCVQGAPGTGKTAVGLHRVAYLLYAHKEQVTRRGVVIIGPNLAFLSYIRNVLPALGELDVTQTTVADMVASTPVKGSDSDATATVKGDARMAVLLKNALWENIKAPGEPLVLSRGSRRLRLRADEIEDLATELRDRGVRYGTGRDLLAHRIAHVLLTQLEAAGETCDDRTHDAVRRSAPVRRCVDEVWPKADPKKLVFALLSDPARIVRNGFGFLSQDEVAALAWRKPPRGPGSAPWTRADQVLIDEVADLIERTPSIAHIVVDEAQDLSPMEARAIGRRCATGAATVLGDIAQGTTPWAATSWHALLSHLGKTDAAIRELDVGYRVPRQILDFASRLLPSIAPALSPAKSLRADENALRVVPVGHGQLAARIAEGCAAALTGFGSVAVICADAQTGETAETLTAAGLDFTILDAAAPGVLGQSGMPEPETRLTLVPVTLAKGLEFDHVVLVEPGRIAAGEAYGLRRLYVALTRAVSRLTVFHAEPLPVELSLHTMKAGRTFWPVPAFSPARIAQPVHVADPGTV